MDWWDFLALFAVAVHIFTGRGFGPLGQPKKPPFPVWPAVGADLRRLLGFS